MQAFSELPAYSYRAQGATHVLRFKSEVLWFQAKVASYFDEPMGCWSVAARVRARAYTHTHTHTHTHFNPSSHDFQSVMTFASF